jgi:cytochrome c biogenesis protein
MRQKNNIWQAFYDQLASIKLTVVTLIVIAFGALIGTLIPQGLTQEHLMEEYGPRWGKIMDFLQLGDLYHATWFRFLLLLLCLNLVVCTLRRFPKTMKLVRFRDEKVEPGKLSQFSHHQRLQSRLPWEELVTRLEATLSREFAPLRRIDAEDAYAGVAERGNWSRLSVYLVHFSVLLVLVGAILGSAFGFKGMMNIVEGASGSRVNVAGGHQTLQLPFEVRCDHFDVSFYDTGTPMEYRSDLTILENGQAILQQPIRVNDPLSYKGITFYQSSYGSTLVSSEIELTEHETGKTTRVSLPFQEPVSLPGTPYYVQVVSFRENIRDLGPALGVMLLREGHEPAGNWILAKIPNFHGNRIQDYQVKVLDFQQARYTGLQVKSDPGVWLVLTGFVLMVVSIGVTFYTSHRKIWVWVSARNPRKEIHIAAKTNKNSLAFEREFDHLLKRLQGELQVKQG